MSHQRVEWTYRLDAAPRDGGDELTTGLAVLMPVVNLTFFGFIGATVKLVSRRAPCCLGAKGSRHRLTCAADENSCGPTAARCMSRCLCNDQNQGSAYQIMKA